MVIRAPGIASVQTNILIRAAVSGRTPFTLVIARLSLTVIRGIIIFNKNVSQRIAKLMEWSG
jgi:hypothetical protein